MSSRRCLSGGFSLKPVNMMWGVCGTAFAVAGVDNFPGRGGSVRLDSAANGGVRV